MWGLLLLFFMLVYLVVIIFLLIKVKPVWGRVFVLIAAILIPNADDWYYRHKLAEYCKTEAGVKVYQQVLRKEGLLSKASVYGDSYLKVIPVAYLEWQIKSDGRITYWRADRSLNGNISKPYEILSYKARFEQKRTELDKGAFVEVIEQIVERENGVVVGEFKGLFYYGGWYPRSLVGRGGLVAGCGADGRVISRKEWHGDAIKGYDGNYYSEIKLIDQVFAKE